MSKTFGLWVLRLTVVGALALVPPVFAEEVLRVLTWPGYADADLVKAYSKLESDLEKVLVSWAGVASPGRRSKSRPSPP